MIESKITCDYSACKQTKDIRPGFLPIGWVSLSQGGLSGAGTMAGTMPFPPEIDAVVGERTYCSALHAAQGLLEALAEGS